MPPACYLVGRRLAAGRSNRRRHTRHSDSDKGSALAPETCRRSGRAAVGLLTIATKARTCQSPLLPSRASPAEWILEPEAQALASPPPNVDLRVRWTRFRR